MSEKDIEDRLRSHAKAFDSLLNLIPAKLYFTQDNSDQWKKRKQTKEESQAAKRAKLDPDQAVTVKEVEDERARERAARDEKRRKLNEDGIPYETNSQRKARRKEEKRRERREKNKGKDGGQVKAGEKKVQTEDQDTDDGEDDEMVVEDEDEKPTSKKTSHPPKSPPKQSASPKKEQHHPAKRKDAKPNGVQLKVNGTEKTGKASIIQNHIVESSGSSDDDDDDGDEQIDDDEEDITADMDEMAQDSDSESQDDSEASDSERESIQRIPGLITEPTVTASSPSPAPSNITDTSTTQKTLAEKLKGSNDPLVQQQLKERLAKRIEELRQARKADGGEAPRTRTELMEQRRKRDELRKTRKKQIRLQAKVEAEKVSQASPADGKKSQSKKNNGVSMAPANYTFGNVKFEDGDKLTADLEGIKTAGKKRGPSDVLGALKHAEAKKARLAGMNEEKRADIQEKDRWSKALKMASGEKLQDDEGLLKKSLKRQEKAKKKSEREWKERNLNVEKGKAMRQKKREANIAARKEQKKAGKGGKKARKVPSKKSKGRAGFEGTGFGGAGKKRK